MPINDEQLSCDSSSKVNIYSTAAQADSRPTDQEKKMSWNLRNKPSGIPKVPKVPKVKAIKPIKPIEPIRPVKPIAPIGKEYYWVPDKKR